MNDKRPFAILGVAALLLLIFFIFMQKNGRRFNWQETYREASKDPYGTFVSHQLLQEYFPDQEFHTLEQSVGESFDSTATGNYLVIGEAVYFDSLSLLQLSDFVYRGGNAFIASKTIPYDLMRDYIYEPCYEYYWDDYYSLEDTLVSLNVFHRDLADSLGFDYKYVFYGDTKPYRWHYIDSLFFCDEAHSLVELGGINDGYINFAKKEYGQGNFYLHTNPLAFTNIQLLDELGLAYSNKVFSHLEEGPIYWDAYSRTAEEVCRRRNQMAGYGGDRKANEGPLKYILAQPSLTWAWYMALALGLLYLFFSAKRKQRIIPVLEENKNTSLEFISTIGRLYFLQNDHRKLSLQKMRLFRNFIRERYNFSLSPSNGTFIIKLEARSEVPKEVIDKIILMSKNIQGSDFVSEKTMVDFHQVLDLFYKNCK